MDGRALTWVDDLVSPDPGRRAAAAARCDADRLADLLARACRDDALSDELVRCALRYLEWESRYPLEWPRNWRLKRELLRALSTRPIGEPHRRELADLVVLAVQRAHHCEDTHYVRAARAIADASLRERLAVLAATSPRAGYVLAMLDDPARGVNSRTWRQWLRSR